MKANAPEKIYLDPEIVANSEVTFIEAIVPGFRAEKNDIEYISKDAFIEKACAWLENNLQGIVGGSIYIEDFKKALKGE